ncbi:MCE family protein [bacterium]|nr:MCE family protein [bacterium]
MRGKTETIVGLFILVALSIFLYMGFKIGAFRFDRDRYSSYSMFFKDLSGLARKAKVKVAGVDVGWVEDFDIVADGQMRARADIMVRRDYKLYSNAYALVRQDGLLGPKFLEIIPGDPLLSSLPSGSVLSEPSVAPVSIDELMQQFKNIAAHVEDVTESFKDAVGGSQGKEQLQAIFTNLDRASQKIASFSDIVDRSLTRNEDNIDVLLGVGQDIKRLSQKLEDNVLPTFQDSITRISDVFDRDFNRVATKLESTAEAVDDASVQAREGLRSVSSIAEKIDEGKGLLGKLINEDETYRDLKIAVSGIKNYFSKTDRMQIVFDSHFEGMYRPAENYRFEDSKGYFDMRIHPNDDHFYILQLVSSQKGHVHRVEKHRKYFDDENNPINTDALALNRKVEHTYRVRTELFKRNTLSVGLQFGKIFDRIALRFGLFENSAGLGIDFDIPFNNDKFRWVTSLEAFDMAGWNRKDDRRPHLKWINKMYFMKNLYLSFGADDFISKRNANAFFGAGIRFGDDDVKYLFSSLGSGLSGVAKGS